MARFKRLGYVVNADYGFWTITEKGMNKVTGQPTINSHQKAPTSGGGGGGVLAPVLSELHDVRVINAYKVKYGKQEFKRLLEEIMSSLD